jgi:hypothetical protein
MTDLEKCRLEQSRMAEIYLKDKSFGVLLCLEDWVKEECNILGGRQDLEIE